MIRLWGQGTFLVSALNELIRLKYELGILVDSEGKRIKKIRLHTVYRKR